MIAIIFLALIVFIMVAFMVMGCRYEVGVHMMCAECNLSVTHRYRTLKERNDSVAILESEHGTCKNVTVNTWEIYR